MPWKRENKNTIMKLWHPFMPKQVGKGRESEKKNLSVRSVPTWSVIENSNKIAKKVQKIKKYHYGFLSSQNRLEKDEKEKK